MIKDSSYTTTNHEDVLLNFQYNYTILLTWTIFHQTRLCYLNYFFFCYPGSFLCLSNPVVFANIVPSLITPSVFPVYCPGGKHRWPGDGQGTGALWCQWSHQPIRGKCWPGLANRKQANVSWCHSKSSQINEAWNLCLCQTEGHLSSICFIWI